MTSSRTSTRVGSTNDHEKRAIAMAFNEIEAAIEKGNREMEAALERIERIQTESVRQPIGDDLGIVHVSLGGALRGIEMNAQAVPGVPDQRLASLVKSAVVAAEKAADQRKRQIQAESKGGHDGRG